MSTPDRPDTSHYWQSEAWAVGITVLSDRDGAFGDFYRKTFELEDDGSLIVHITREGAAATTRPAVEIKTITYSRDGQSVTVESHVDDNGLAWAQKWTITPTSAIKPTI
jgi:hypothetical protein